MQSIEIENGEICFYNNHKQLKQKITKTGYYSYIYSSDESKSPISYSFVKDVNAIAPLFIVSSVSASGKTTIVEKAMKELNLKRLITHTTRPIRTGETSNEYYFRSEDDFKYLSEHDKFIESSCVYGNYYGLSKDEVFNNVNVPRFIILDVKGFKKLKNIYPNCIGIFILPPARNILIDRLADRKGDVDDMNRRIAEMDEEMANVDKYDHTIDFDSLDKMEQEFVKVVKTYLTK